MPQCANTHSHHFAASAVNFPSSLSDPLTQVTAYADVLRNTGAVGPREEALIRKQQDLCVSLIQARKWSAFLAGSLGITLLLNC